MSELLAHPRLPIPRLQLDGRFMGFPIALLGVVCDWITTQEASGWASTRPT